MNIYKAENIENIADNLMQTLEQQTGKNIFTMRLLDEGKKDSSLDVLVIFTDRTVLMGWIVVENIFDTMAFRIQGDFI